MLCIYFSFIAKLNIINVITQQEEQGGGGGRAQDGMGDVIATWTNRGREQTLNARDAQPYISSLCKNGAPM